MIGKGRAIRAYFTRKEEERIKKVSGKEQLTVSCWIRDVIIRKLEDIENGKHN